MLERGLAQPNAIPKGIDVPSLTLKIVETEKIIASLSMVFQNGEVWLIGSDEEKQGYRLL